MRMKNILNYVIILLLMVIVIGCSNSKSEIISTDESVIASQQPTILPTTTQQPKAAVEPAKQINGDSQIPETYMITGKDKDGNLLEMTQEEADGYIMSGKVLLLFDDSWYDFDGDDTPEHIQFMLWDKEDERQNSTYETENRYYDIKITGMEPIETGPVEENPHIGIVSLDKKDIQYLIPVPQFLAGEYHGRYGVYSIVNKAFVSTGFLGCEISKFELEDDKTYQGSITNLYNIFGGLSADTINYFDEDKVNITLNEHPEIYVMGNELTINENVWIPEESLELIKGDKVKIIDFEIANSDDIIQYHNTHDDWYSMWKYKVCILRIEDDKKIWLYCEGVQIYDMNGNPICLTGTDEMVTQLFKECVHAG